MTSQHAEFGLCGREGMHQIFHDQSLLITDLHGEVSGGIHGAYYANTRVLSRLQLRINGEALFPVQGGPVRDDLLVAYLHPDLNEAVVLRFSEPPRFTAESG